MRSRRTLTLIALTASLIGTMAVGTALAQTGTFIDRFDPDDLRVVTYNVNSDSIFPGEDPVQAAKFDRVVNALDPDILHLQEIYNYSDDDVVDLMNDIAPLPGAATWYAYKDNVAAGYGDDAVIISKYPLSLTAKTTIPSGNRELAMALVDLPDAQYDRDFYFMNNHYRCCGGNDPDRQQQSDAMVNWMRDARTAGEYIDLPEGTPMAVVGDLNIVDGNGPLDTLITGDIDDESTYGADSPPDWDGSNLTDAHPLHNDSGPDDYTWRNDNSSYDPGRLDFIIYTDSVLTVANSFVLNTVDMTPAERSATGLQQYDVTFDTEYYDHLPVVVDFRLPLESTCETPGDLDGDLDGDGDTDGNDFLTFSLCYNGALRPPLSGCQNTCADLDRDGDADGDDFLTFSICYNGSLNPPNCP